MDSRSIGAVLTLRRMLIEMEPELSERKLWPMGFGELGLDELDMEKLLQGIGLSQGINLQPISNDPMGDEDPSPSGKLSPKSTMADLVTALLNTDWEPDKG